MVEIKITENEERNEYLIEPYQAFLGARYDNLSDEIKVIFPQKEIDNESSCTMIITNGDEPIDCVTVYNDEVFKLKSPATQYKQVFIGFSFQKPDGYIKNTNIGLFFFRGAQSPDAIVPTTPIQREKINLLLASGFTGVAVVEDDAIILKFMNVDGAVVEEISLPKADLTEYVKFTNGAHYDKAGVVYTPSGEESYTGVFAKNGIPMLVGSARAGALSDVYFNNPKNYTVPLLSHDLYRWLKVGITTNTEEWTDEDKAKARALIGLTVSNLDYGIELFNGILRIRQPSDWNIINARDNGWCSPVTLSKADLVVKEVLSNYQGEAWTEAQKEKARTLLGIDGLIAELLARIEALENK